LGEDPCVGEDEDYNISDDLIACDWMIRVYFLFGMLNIHIMTGLVGLDGNQKWIWV
jgi:hypothetical protein